MDKHQFTYSCGHSGTLWLCGSPAYRDQLLEALRSVGLCPDCHSREIQRHATEAVLAKQRRNSMTPCIHTNAHGLCPACQADYDEDPTSWEDWGNHPAGIARYEALVREIQEDAAGDPVKPYGEDVPL